ncbi:MAG: patatin-like phospholipase family protein [Candidatus Marinimicrobia bacterium]|nr:patatin-like phospholipase family protein [Candidatus Neomarinimicrobiota bacterium]
MKKKVGLALGGGGARGLAHVGVLKVLEEEQILIDYIAGTSMGAIIGAMYAQNPSADALIDRLKSFFSSQDYDSLGLKYIVPKNDQNPSFLSQLAQVVAKRIIVNIAQSRTGIIKTDRLSEAISILIDKGNIQDTHIPFACAATDLNSGQPILFQKGDIQKAVTISSSIPGFISPIVWDGKLLTDGSVTAPVPVDEAREMGADLVIEVCVGINQIRALKDPNIIDIISRTDAIRGFYLSKLQLANADVSLHPDVKDTHWSEFLRYKEFINAGIVEAQKKLPEIHNVIKKKKCLFRGIFYKR